MQNYKKKIGNFLLKINRRIIVVTMFNLSGRIIQQRMDYNRAVK
jgi:hypothetical protein